MNSQKKVLVIDDEQIVLDSVNKILTGDNYEVTVTLKGRKGIKLAVQKKFDIVLTDIRMPDVGGLIVLRDIKRANPAIPVVIITGFATTQSAVRAMKLGAADYLEKPFTPDVLLKTIDRAIRSSDCLEPETQDLIHPEEIIRILERAAFDTAFSRQLLIEGADALEPYDLTGPERLALITGDIHWIEQQIGKLTTTQKKWLTTRLSAEIW